MTLRSYLIFMAASTAVAMLGVAMIILNVDPDQAPWSVFAILYALIFLAVAGLFSLIGFSARVFLLNKRLQISREVAVSFRQAVLIATAVTIALFLQGKGRLNWWTGSLMLVIMTLTESFYLSGGQRRPPEPTR